MSQSTISATSTPDRSRVRTTEYRVRIGGADRSLVGILNLPDGIASPPVVLMLHGFTGQKDEFAIADSEEGLFAYTARRLSENGLASLRIDFYGSGESDGQWEKTTLTGQIGDAVLAFDYLQALPSVKGTRIGILGYSQGGLVGSHLAALRPIASAMVLWAPVTNPMSTYGILMGKDTVTNAISGSDGSLVSAKLSWGGETKLRGAFFKELPFLLPNGVISRYPGPLRVIVGLRETVVAPQPEEGQRLIDHHMGMNDLIEIDSDHDWNASTGINTIANLLIPQTIQWFEHLERS